MCYADDGSAIGLYESAKADPARAKTSRSVVHAEMSDAATPGSYRLIQKGASWYAVSPVEFAVFNARVFGSNLVEKFSAQNIMLGITQLGKTADVRRALADVISCLDTGSLYDAMDQVRAIPAESKDPIFVTDARMLEFINSIETYLGLPKSSQL
jgi:hypothetical protein